jgi:hypothetical protein
MIHTLILLTAGTGLAALVGWAWERERIIHLVAAWRAHRAAAAQWRDGRDLVAGLAAIHAALTACPVCGGRHCAGCEAPARITAAPHHHVGRHAQEEIPPSILRPALAMSVVERARELTRQLGPGRPALPLRVRVHLARTVWEQRAGRRIWLGHGRAIGGVA